MIVGRCVCLLFVFRWPDCQSVIVGVLLGILTLGAGVGIVIDGT